MVILCICFGLMNKQFVFDLEFIDTLKDGPLKEAAKEEVKKCTSGKTVLKSSMHKIHFSFIN